MLRYVKLGGIILLFVLFLSSPGFSQTQTEQLVITTYYPSPYGSYRQLQVTDSGAVASRTALIVSQGNTGGGTSYAITANNPAASGGTNVAGSFTASGGTTNTGLIASGTNYGLLVTGGSVGIGRIPIGNILEVEGNASKTAASAWLANSDSRIKKDVHTITNALEVINELRPVKFRYTEKYRAEHPSLEDRYYYNFIAQEFQKVFPDSVKKENDKEGYLQIDTYNIGPFLVAAVQELKAENEALAKRISVLEKNSKVASK